MTQDLLPGLSWTSDTLLRVDLLDGVDGRGGYLSGTAVWPSWGPG